MCKISWFLLVTVYKESYSVDPQRFHKETSTLLVQPRQVELKVHTNKCEDGNPTTIILDHTSTEDYILCSCMINDNNTQAV